MFDSSVLQQCHLGYLISIHDILEDSLKPYSSAVSTTNTTLMNSFMIIYYNNILFIYNEFNELLIIENH